MTRRITWKILTDSEEDTRATEQQFTVSRHANQKTRRVVRPHLDEEFLFED